MSKHFELGDWKLLYILSKNMEPLVFGEFLRELYKTMKSVSAASDDPNQSSLKKPLYVHEA